MRNEFLLTDYSEHCIFDIIWNVTEHEEGYGSLNKFRLIEFTRGAPATQNRATCDIFMTIHHNFVAVAKRKEWS
jgi:hypothetical protein